MPAVYSYTVEQTVRFKVGTATDPQDAIRQIIENPDKWKSELISVEAKKVGI